MYGFIYMTTNLINGKMYIGKKTYGNTDKWKTYLGSGNLLKKAIAKYGEENFKREILENCQTVQELNEAEKKWIKKFNATDDKMFYNISSGGDGGNTIAGYSDEQLQEYKNKKKMIHKKTALKGSEQPNSILKENQVYSVIGMMIRNKSDKEIADFFNISQSAIRDIRAHRTWKSVTEDLLFPKLKKNTAKHNKKVVQYDKNGNKINTYQSGVEAEIKTGISRKLISAVCNGEKKTAYGYVWRFETDAFDKYISKNTHFITIYQYDLDNNLIQTYNTIKNASKHIGISTYRIKNAINSKTHICDGYKFVTKKEDIDNGQK